MRRTERVVESLNRALHELFRHDEQLYLLGEDIADPYGGAFKVTSGLAGAYPGRVLTTPISESAILGVANGLALTGNKVIVEVMFGDFATLIFDQLVNFTAKSVAMYGRRQPMHVVLRCPVGGNRGYGPTHSQSLQKHFVGIPNLSLYELSPFHDATKLLGEMLAQGEPAVLFEGKTLYPERVYRSGRIDDAFAFEFCGGETGWARAYAPNAAGPELVLITSGGMVSRALNAARGLVTEDGLNVQILVPAKLSPLSLDAIGDLLLGAEAIAVAEESTAHGTWGTEVARHVYERTWGHLRRPVALINSLDSVIPAAPHLERKVLVQSDTIREALRSLARIGGDGPARKASPERPPSGRHAVTVPKLNNNDASYVLLAWLADEGRPVTAGQPLAELETSKAVEEISAQTTGILRQNLAAGAECLPNDVLGYLVPPDISPGEDATDRVSVSSVSVSMSAGGPQLVTGHEEPPATETAVHVLPRAQRLVADVVSLSHREIPDAFAAVRASLDAVSEAQRRLDKQGHGPVGLPELLIKALAGLHARFPLFFGRLGEGGVVHLTDHAHVGITLDAGNGLYIPVIKNAAERPVDEIADELAAFRMKAFRGAFREDELDCANITISWNHEPDVVIVHPVIPPGQTCILSVGGQQSELHMSEAGDVVRRPVTQLGLAHDHRVINGREAIAFLQELKTVLEAADRLEDLATHRTSKLACHWP